MALTVITTYPAKGLALSVWTGLANTNTGLAAACGQWSDKTVQISGTPGATPGLTLEGSNDGTNWATLHNAQGVALVLIAAGIELIAENPMFIRPRVSGGDGTTVWSVSILGVNN